MSGPVEGPIAPSPSALTPTPGLASSSRTRAPLRSVKTPSSSFSAVADVRLELNAPRISSDMGARLVVAFVELLLYLKGQVPFPPSQLRRMVAGGRKGSPHQNKLLKSLYTLSDDLPSTLRSIGPQNIVTLAVVFGLGREKCFVQLSGADFEQPQPTDGDVSLAERGLEQKRLLGQESSSNENTKYNTVPIRRRSPRPPLQELSSIDSLSSQLSSISLRPNAEESLIRQSERALSQAMACSEVEFSGHLQPMGARVYLRAPRSFKHSSWGVRPEAARMLDAPLADLVAGEAPRVELVRICAKDATPTDSDEEEMIWWGWDGRLAGYA